MQHSVVSSRIFSYALLLLSYDSINFSAFHYTDLAGRYGCPSYTCHKKGTRHSRFECTVFLLSAFVALLLHRSQAFIFSVLPNLPLITGFQNPIELQPLRAKNGCTGVSFLHDMGSRVRGLDVADLTVNALLCRRDAAIAINTHNFFFLYQKYRSSF